MENVAEWQQEHCENENDWVCVTCEYMTEKGEGSDEE
jgi:hypothetical protein